MTGAPLQRITAAAVVSLLLQVQQVLVVASPSAGARPQELNRRLLVSELSSSSGATAETIVVEDITAATPGFFVDSVETCFANPLSKRAESFGVRTQDVP